MATVSGFRALRYAKENVANLDEVITPPFDVISPIERDSLAERSPYNMVHLILPQGEGEKGPYENARSLLDAWVEEGVLRQDDEDSFYLLEQQFTGQSGCDYVRRGFFAKVKLPEEGEKSILGHEKTFPNKIKDRLELTRATRTYFGAIFGLYSDPDNELHAFGEHMDDAEADETAHTIDGVTQRVWRISVSQKATEFFLDKTIYIADGHHRFATALAYRDEMRRLEHPDGLRPYDYLLMGLVPFEDPGLIVRSAHRIVDPPADFDFSVLETQLEPFFDVRRVTNGLAQEVAQSPGASVGIALATGDQYLLQLKDVDRTKLLGADHGPAWRSLDVALLHRGILENLMGLSSETELRYEPDAAKALAACKDGAQKMTCILNPVSMEQIRACADAGEFMPQKATYLFPKLPTGVVLLPLV